MKLTIRFTDQETHLLNEFRQALEDSGQGMSHEKLIHNIAVNYMMQEAAKAVNLYEQEQQKDVQSEQAESAGPSDELPESGAPDSAALPNA